MKAPNTLKVDPYIDEIAANLNPGTTAKFRKASLNPNANIDSLEDAKAASVTEHGEGDFELETEDLVEGDGEFEFEREKHSDDFTSHDPYKDRHRDQNQEQGQNQQRKQRKLGKVGRRNAPEPTREEVFSFLEGLDKLLDKAKQNSEVDETEAEFENWNNWFKQEKKAPPAPDSSKVFYVREEYNTKRSSHLWKSNPDKKWVLAFGNNEINNVVSANLYKYQNETISKDA